jgi:hypothetical protein
VALIKAKMYREITTENIEKGQVLKPIFSQKFDTSGMYADNSMAAKSKRLQAQEIARQKLIEGKVSSQHKRLMLQMLR